jgi:hypothetical protein
MIQFVALDGEAIKGSYVLLGSSIPGKCLENREGITTGEALRWLWSLGNNRLNRKKHVTYVAFFFSYDVEMILKDLPLKKKVVLFKTGEVEYKNYKIKYVKRKFFSVRRTGQTTNGITIYDACGFFIGQGGFVPVLESFKIPVPPEIRSGKKARSGFTWKDYDKIKHYNFLECVKLVELMEVVYKLCETIDLVPRRWYGSSALAAVALRKWKVDEVSRRTTEETCPPKFFDAITRAYFGGRIEAFKLGSFKNIFGYDINSAYPWEISQLPITKGNYWFHSKKFAPDNIGVWRVKFKFPSSQTIGFFPFRMMDGSIKFPLQGEGWYWKPEIDVALKHFPECVEIVEGYFLLEEELTILSEKIPTLYKQRLAYKKKGNLSQWIIKILLNAMYGKFAQKVGRADFKNFCYAGLITSGTRAKIRDACIGREDSIIAFATDGIYSQKPLNLKHSERLGQWECKQYKRGSVIQSGIYLMETMEGKVKTKQRGYADPIAWGSLLDELNKTGELEIEIKIFVGFLLAFNFKNDFGADYLKFVSRKKVIKPNNKNGKRRYQISQIKNWKTDWCASRPIERLDGLSYPIKMETVLTEEDLYELLEDLEN